MNQVLENQTLFNAEEPILNDYPDVKEQMADSRLSKNIKFRIILLVVLGFVLSLVLLLFLFLRKSSKQTPDQNPSAENKDVVKNKTEFESQISEIRSDMSLADPNIIDLPFPPVDLNTSLFVLEKK